MRKRKKQLAAVEPASLGGGIDADTVIVPSAS